MPSIWGGIQSFLRTSGTGVYYPVNVKELGWKIGKNELEDLSVDKIAEMFNVNRKRAQCNYGIDGR